MKLSLRGHFGKVVQFTQGTWKKEKSSWNERNDYYEGQFVFDNDENFITVHIDNSYFNSLKEDGLITDDEELFIEGYFHVEVSRGTGIATHYLDIIATGRVN